MLFTKLSIWDKKNLLDLEMITKLQDFIKENNLDWAYIL